MATLRVRPMFASVPGMSSPPAFGGNQRAIVVSVDPEKLRAQNLTLEQVTDALAAGNAVTPSGQPADRRPPVPGEHERDGRARTRPASWARCRSSSATASVLLRDVATIEDAADITAGYVLVNGRRSVYMLVTKRADASHPRGRGRAEEGPAADAGVGARGRADRLRLRPVADRDGGHVGRRRRGAHRGAAHRADGAALPPRLAERRRRRAEHPPRPARAAVFALWVTGQTINLMTLGGLALAVGILVDEATVEVENIHTQMLRYDSVAAGRAAAATRRRRCRGCWPCCASWRCSCRRSSWPGRPASCSCRCRWPSASPWSPATSCRSTFVPVLCVWLLHALPEEHAPERGFFHRVMNAYERSVAAARPLPRRRRAAVPAGRRFAGRLPLHPAGHRHLPADGQGPVHDPHEGPDRHAGRVDGGDGPGGRAADPRGGRRGQRRGHPRLRRHVPHQLPRPGVLPVDERPQRGAAQGGPARGRGRGAGGREGAPPRPAFPRARGVARGAVEAGGAAAGAGRRAAGRACGCRSSPATS